MSEEEEEITYSSWQLTPGRWLRLTGRYILWKVGTTARRKDEHWSEAWYFNCRHGSPRGTGDRKTCATNNCQAKLVVHVDKRAGKTKVFRETAACLHNHPMDKEWLESQCRPEAGLVSQIRKLTVDGKSCAEVRDQLDLNIRPELLYSIRREAQMKLKECERENELLITSWVARFPHLNDAQIDILRNWTRVIEPFIEEVAQLKDPSKPGQWRWLYSRQWEQIGSIISAKVGREEAKAILYLLNFGQEMPDASDES